MKSFASILLFTLVIFSCKKDEKPAVLDTTPYPLEYGNFPKPPIPADNQLTNTKVQLGRLLFYDKNLSEDGTQSCGSCHLQANGFNDFRDFSIGIKGLPGKRNAMTIANLAWHTNGFFWDGRATTLREQSLKPIQDLLEMHETLENVVNKTQNNSDYRDPFIRAFGDFAVTSERISLVLEQFMNTLVTYNSKFDQWKAGKTTLTESENRGRELFFREPDLIAGIKGAECFHCHGGFDFTDLKYTSNGLDFDFEFTDLGRYEVTKNEGDKARFKVPSLRNIVLTAPYMHDSRFKTLEETVEHYNTGVKFSSTLDPSMTGVAQNGLNLNEQDKLDLINFMKTLTDSSFINNPNFADPRQ